MLTGRGGAQNELLPFAKDLIVENVDRRRSDRFVDDPTDTDEEKSSFVFNTDHRAYLAKLRN